MKEVYEVMKKYGRFMATRGYAVGNARLIQKTSDGVYATVDGCDIGNISEKDIIKLPGSEMPVPCGDMKAMVYSQTPFCMEMLKKGKPFRASLDDMAQIFGPEARIVDVKQENKDRERDIKKALRDNVGFLAVEKEDTEGNVTGHALTFGRTLYEAVVAVTVLEKSAEVTALSEKIGGAKPIARWEAKLMRMIYKKKYSKAEEEVRAGEVK